MVLAAWDDSCGHKSDSFLGAVEALALNWSLGLCGGNSETDPVGSVLYFGYSYQEVVMM